LIGIGHGNAERRWVLARQESAQGRSDEEGAARTVLKQPNEKDHKPGEEIGGDDRR